MSQELPSLETLLAAIKKAASIVEPSKWNFNKNQLACIKRWRNGTVPRVKALRELLPIIWNLELKGVDAPLHKDLEPAFGSFTPREVETQPAVAWTRARFTAWFVECFEAAQERVSQENRRRRDSRRKDLALILKRIPGNPGRVDASPEVIRKVDEMLKAAGVTVDKHHAVPVPDCLVSLAPLYEYVDRLQRSARIPGYYPGVPEIILDELYVELSAAPDQRGLDSGGQDSRDWTEADPKVPDHFERWRLAANRQRISPATLLSEAAVEPVVVLGDPGSGKSTLSRFLLHELGRSLLGASKLQFHPVLPFRIALSELAQEARAKDVSVLRYLARTQLRVGETDLDNWVTLLSHFATDTRPFRLLLLVDGIDEATPDKETYGKICDRLSDVSSVAMLVFTSRRAGFHPPFPKFGAYELVPLSDLSIQAMIRNWFRAVRRQPEEFVQSFTTWVFADSRRQQMAGNPCLLALLCYLNQDIRAGRFLQASCRAQLYALAVDKLRNDMSRGGVGPVNGVLSLLAGFAMARYTSQDEGRGPEVLFRDQQALDYLRTRLGELQSGELEPVKILDAWREMRLVAQWDLGSWHHFLHQTFQEYFAACGLLALPVETVSVWLAHHRFNPYWREVWRFYAGLCRDHLPDGRARFRGLIQAVCVPADEFGEVGFFAAPLCTEYGVPDTTVLFGYDLRQRLFQALRERHRRSMGAFKGLMAGLGRQDLLEMREARTLQDPFLVTRARVMVELDPRYFLNWVRRTLDGATEVNDLGRPRAREVDPTSVLFGVLILNCIYHPDALAYQRELIAREMRNPRLEPGDPPLGPCLATGRNESLCRQLVELDVKRLSKVHRLRVIRYLACTRSDAAADHLIRMADLANLKNQDGLEILCRCLGAMSDLQDVKAVELARRLWRRSNLPEGMFEAACMYLAQLKTPEAAGLLEEWLLSGKLKSGSPEFHHVLDRLKEWRDLKVPDALNRMLESPNLPLHAESALWELVVAREGVPGFKRLEERVELLAVTPRLGERGWHVVAGLVQILVKSRIPRFTVISELADRVPRRFGMERQRILGGLIELRASDCKALESEEWLVSTAIPLLESELKRCAGKKVEAPWTWLGCWSQCTLTVLSALADMALRIWKKLPPDVAAELFHNFNTHPELVPVRVAREFFASRSDELRRAGMELLLETDPGFLMAKRKSSEVEELLRETSCNTGVLFFKDQLYSPSKARFVRYSGKT